MSYLDVFMLQAHIVKMHKSMKNIICWVFPAVVFFCVSNIAKADSVDFPTLGLTQVVSNSFSHPVIITHAGDSSGRIFVVEQGGRILIVQSNSVLTQPFMDNGWDLRASASS